VKFCLQNTFLLTPAAQIAFFIVEDALIIGCQSNFHRRQRTRAQSSDTHAG
jgi:hypothetical protein